MEELPKEVTVECPCCGNVVTVVDDTEDMVICDDCGELIILEGSKV